MKTKKIFPIIAGILVVAIVAVILTVLAQEGAFQTKPKQQNDAAIVRLVVADGEIKAEPVADFEQFIRESDRPVFVDFWARWCQPCLAAAPFVEQLALEYDGRAHIVKVDIDLAMELSSRYGAQSIPLFTVFSGGQIKDSVTGYAPQLEGNIKAMIDDALS